MKEEQYLKKIKRYYDDSQFLYGLFWMNKRNLAMHFGYWESDTKNRHEALLNENIHVAKVLDIKSSDLILDAGCGVGGTAIWIVENYGADVMGITIVDKQVRLAKKYAIKRKVDKKAIFSFGDYTATGYSDSSFDKIYAIESVCHAIDKEAFIKEAYRILKPGGKLCVCDYFINNLVSASDKKDYALFCDGWAMPDLPYKTSFESLLSKNGFGQIKFNDNTKKVLKSSLFMKKSSKAWLAIDHFLNRLHIVTDENVIGTEASISQYNLFKRGALYHGSFVAEKKIKK